MKKELRKLIRELRPQGWTYGYGGNGHIKLIHPSGQFVTVSVSPSCGYWENNVRRDVKRLIKRVDGNQCKPAL